MEANVYKDGAKLFFTKPFKKIENIKEVKFLDYRTMIRCPYCGKEMISITRHLKSHGITKEKFVAGYGGVSLTEMVANKIMKWYKPNTNKWALQTGNEWCPYVTFTTEKQKEKAKNGGKKNIPYYLTVDTVNAHLKKNLTLAIYPCGEYAGWICFDIDTDQAVTDTKKIVDTLVKYISRKDILVTLSGNKGYHIELFFQEKMKYRDIQYGAPHCQDKFLTDLS